MRVTTAFNMLLALPGVNVTAVEFTAGRVLVDVRLRRRRLACPHCGFTTAARHNLQQQRSSWRALDLGVWRVTVRCRLRRVRCPEHGVVVEAVPFARHGAPCTRDVDDLVAWLATKMDKTAITRLLRVNWRTVGAIVERVVADRARPPPPRRPLRDRHRRGQLPQAAPLPHDRGRPPQRQGRVARRARTPPPRSGSTTRSARTARTG